MILELHVKFKFLQYNSWLDIKNKTFSSVTYVFWSSCGYEIALNLGLASKDLRPKMSMLMTANTNWRLVILCVMFSLILALQKSFLKIKRF